MFVYQSGLFGLADRHRCCAAGEDVGAHGGIGPLRVACRKGRNDGAVLSQTPYEVSVTVMCESLDQHWQPHDLADQSAQVPVAGSEHDRAMQVAVEFEVATAGRRRIVAEHFFHFQEDLVELRKVFCFGSRRRESGTVTFEQDSEPVDFLSFVVADAGDDATAPGLDDDQPIGLQLSQRFTHRRAADIEFSADFSFLETIAAGEFAAHDFLSQSGIGFVYGCGHRVSLHGGLHLVYQTKPERGKLQQETRWVH